MSDPNIQSQIKTFDRNPNTAGIPAGINQLGILKTAGDGSVWRFIGGGVWQLLIPASSLGGSFSPVPMTETLNLAVGGSAVHYIQVGQASNIKAFGAVLNGTTINSAADVAITLQIVGGAVLGVINLANGTVAGAGATTTLGAVVSIPAGSRISATVTTAATVAAGTASITLALYAG